VDDDLIHFRAKKPFLKKDFSEINQESVTRRDAVHVRLAEQPLHGALGGRLLDVLAPGWQVAPGRADRHLAVAGPADAAIAELEHLGGSAGEGIRRDHGYGFFDFSAPE
jgi:hypothetical protein